MYMLRKEVRRTLSITKVDIFIQVEPIYLRYKAAVYCY